MSGLVLFGCAGSVPRFRAGDDQVDRGEDDVRRLAGKIREEETREDDRRISREEAQRRVVQGNYRNDVPAGLERDKLLLEVVSYLGVPYAYGGTTRNGMDCSAFTSVVYARGVHRPLPRSTHDQFSVGSPVLKRDLEFGDLVFFNTTGRTPSHVGVYIEDDLFAHASVTYGVTISSLESSYYKKRFVGARRVVEQQ